MKLRWPFLCCKRSRYEALVSDHAAAEALVGLHTAPGRKHDARTADCIVFSKDRALQLHALLASFYEQVSRPVPVHVLFSATGKKHGKAYDDVFSLFQRHGVVAIRQKNADSFREQFLSLLKSLESEAVFCLVDDIVVTERIDMDDFLQAETRESVPSLRLGTNLSRAYTTQQDQPLPPFIDPDPRADGKRRWFWKDGACDWGYPLSLDGNLFSTREFLLLAERCRFRSPNTLEDDLQRYSKYFKNRHGICYTKSKIMNIPANRVQNDIENIHGDVHQDHLLEQWSRGMQLDYRAYYGFVNASAHQDVEFRLVQRDGRQA